MVVQDAGNVGIGTFNPFGGQLIVSTTNGNVGIGTMSPGQTLDVTGTVRATGFIAGTSGITLGGVTNTSWPATGSNYWNYNGAGNIGVSTILAVGIGTTFIGGAGEAALAVINGNVGIGTWVPNSTATVNGSFSLAYINVSANTTLNTSHYAVNVDTTGGGVTITLPAAAGIGGRCYLIKDAGGNAGTNTITVASNGGTIDKNTTMNISINFQEMQVCSNNTNWLVY